MKIFLSWSRPHSRTVAEALNDWLPRVIQAVKPFYSPEIEKGAKWSSEIDEALEGTRFGIICLTPGNLNSVWIHYEAGALSKTKDALIWTFLHGLTPGDVPPPLGKFQHTVAEKQDVLRLLKTINSRLAAVGGEPLLDRLLEENFELFWPRLEERLATIEQINDNSVQNNELSKGDTLRDERAILDEILELVRSQERRLLSVEEKIAPQQMSQGVIKQPDDYALIQTLDISIPSSVEGAESIATQLLTILVEDFPGSKPLMYENENGFNVAISFPESVSTYYIRRLIKNLSREIQYSIDKWEGLPF